MQTLVPILKKINVKSSFVSISLLLLVLSPYIPVQESLDHKIWITAAIFVLGIVLWISNILPAPLTGIIIIVLFSAFEVLTFEEAASGLGNEVIWLVLAVLFMGIAIEESSLDKRIAYSLLSLSKGHVKSTLFYFIMSGLLLTFLIPNAVGRLAVLLPIGKGIISHMEKEGGENIGKAIMLIVTYAPYITTVALLTGASGSIYATGLFESMLGYSWNYLDWMILMIPMVILILLALWLILIILYPAKAPVIKEGQHYFEQERKKMGNMTKSEKKLLSLYILLILLWITRDYHHLSIALSSVIVMILLFLPGINLLQFKKAIKKVDWGIPILFASGFAIAHAFKVSGIVYFLSDISFIYLKDLSAFTLALAMMTVFIIIRLCFTNFNAMVATLMPIALTFSISTPYNPLWLGMICLIASSTAYLLPTQAIGSMMTFSLGYYTHSDMLKAGSLLTVCIIIITLFVSFLYWPLLGFDRLHLVGQ